MSKTATHLASGHSSVWLECSIWDAEVVGSNPTDPTMIVMLVVTTSYALVSGFAFATVAASATPLELDR